MTAQRSDALVSFLLTRIAEDAAVARDASARQRRWRTDADGCCVIVDDHGFYDNVETHVNAPAAQHIARHDPARVLADCEAKREVVGFFDSWLVESNPFTKRNPSMPTMARECLQQLALPYADHPDFDEEWRP